MRARLILFACLLLVAAPAVATDPPAPKPVVILPVAPMPSPVPQPMPGPPATVTKLEKGARYVVRASKQCDMVISPEGLVEVEEKKGPRDWTAIFAGGTGDYEDRHYDDPFLYSVKAVGTGTVKVTFIPRGYTTPKEWVEATIEANNGPRPPDPAPVVGLSKVSKDGAAQVVSANKATEQAALARAQRGIASAIAAGGLEKPNDILTAWRAANNAAVSSTTWKPWGEACSAALSKMYSDKKLADKAAWVTAFEDIAKGLE